jgi:2-iminoacetate synthase ThiH
MGRLLTRAVAQAGLSEIAARALEGRGLDAADIERLRAADVLVVAGLADAVRKKHRGDEVRVLSVEAARREPELCRLDLPAGGAEGPTGQELLVQVALARLRTPCDKAIGFSFEQLGLELSQTALVFGADALFGDLGSKRTLPLLDGQAARRAELTGLIERSGRRVRFVEVASVSLESRS